MGTRTRVEASEGTQDGNGDGAGTERKQGRGCRPVDEHKTGAGTGAGTETRAVAETGTGMETRMGTRTGSWRAEERRRSAKDCTKVVDAMQETG